MKIKRLFIILILSLLSSHVACGWLRTYYRVINGIDINRTDPRLFSYDDSTIINRHLISSLLENMYGKYPVEKKTREDEIEDDIPAPFDDSDMHYFRPGEVDIVELANTFVKDGELSIPYNFAIGPVKKNDIVLLREMFNRVPDIEAKDIIDVINIQKQIDRSSMFELLEMHCYPGVSYMDVMDYSDDYGEESQLWKKWDDISRKYKHKNLRNKDIPYNTNSSANYYVLNTETFTIDEKIGILECMIEKLKNDSIDNREFGEVIGSRIKIWEHALDSLQSRPYNH